MIALIIIFGTLTFFAGLVVVMNPDLILSFLQRQLGTVRLHAVNVVVRVFFGTLLIAQANISQCPIVIETIGWFCIAIAVILILLGRGYFNRLMSWAVSLVETYNRVGGVLIMIFGAFLVYAFT